MRQYLGPRPVVDYQVHRDNGRWPDHVARSYVTGGLLAWLKPLSVLDPACGDASIVRIAHRNWPIDEIYLGDISKQNVDASMKYFTGGNAVAHVGDAVDMIASTTNVDAIVLTEFLEHVEDPDAVLALSRKHAKWLVASSPVMRPGQVDQNKEHLWMFDADGYEEMLMLSGWEATQRTFLHFKSEYDFGIWVCR